MTSQSLIVLSGYRTIMNCPLTGNVKHTGSLPVNSHLALEVRSSVAVNADRDVTATATGVQDLEAIGVVSCRIEIELADATVHRDAVIGYVFGVAEGG